VNEVMRYNATETVRAGGTEVSRQKHPVKAVVMVAAYKAAARFIEKIRDKRLDPLFLNVSFVGSTALAEELKEGRPSSGEGIIVTQVVPHYESGGTGVIRYREALTKFHPDQQPEFTSLEGFVVGTLFAEGLKRCGHDCGTEKLIDALEMIRDLDLGTGATLTFGPSQHQASHKVWGTILDNNWRFGALDID
jgi:hypothetical protein